MNIFSPSIDYSGARGSNTGDQFHELWALRQVLGLLRPGTNLKAVGVEGVRSETKSKACEYPTWDGVDCALYYGGDTLESANFMEFVQLKYSAANPEKNWSVARLTQNTSKRGNNSIIRKMADDFKDAKSKLKKEAGLKIRLVSNQGLSSNLEKLLKTELKQIPEDEKIGKTTENLNRFFLATGLSEEEFHVFFSSLDFSECGYHSRFAEREKVVEAAADLLGDDVSSEVRDLQIKIRELMSPERASEIVIYKDILLWFGLSSHKGLFPCPPEIRLPERPVKRSILEEVLGSIQDGERIILTHGVGGCGKTTLLCQIGEHMPKDSVIVLFDSFGGGRYIYSDDKRHLPENAFLQIANEIAVELGLPLFIPRNTKYPATIQSFMAKLHSAGEALQNINPAAILLIIIDAADNAVMVAENVNPPERPFFSDLFEANLSDLPVNVRFIVSCRSARRDILKLPLRPREILCPPFTKPETRKHLETTFSNPGESLVEQFHCLSKANPRVQSYAISAAEGNPDRLLEALIPGGKSLSDVLNISFDNALKKLGQERLFDKLIGGLAFLPAPVSITSFARFAGCDVDVLRDFALDLAPGLRIDGDGLTVADEDFVNFIKDKASENRTSVISQIAEDFFETFQEDAYSSIHIANALIGAGRGKDILSVIENDPDASAIEDPIARRQVQVERLRLSLAACEETDSKPNAIKTILISAEAERDDHVLHDTLGKELDLSVEFAASSMRRAILMDRSKIREHGSVLAQDMVRAIRAGDRKTAREQLAFHNAWLRRRNSLTKRYELERWNVSIRDISARVETILELFGPEEALSELMRWTPREVSLQVAFIIVPELIAAGKSHHIKSILHGKVPKGPWDLLLWIPLAMAGESVDGHTIEKSLRRIRHCFIPDLESLYMLYGQTDWQSRLLDTFISACELAFKLNLNCNVIVEALNRILKVLEGNKSIHLSRSDVFRIDGLVRCWLLHRAISGNKTNAENFIEYLKSLHSDHIPTNGDVSIRKNKNSGTEYREAQENERLYKRIKSIFPIYLSRIEILVRTLKNQRITDERLKSLGSISVSSYDLRSDYYSFYFCETAAKAVMGLLIIGRVKASKLIEHASNLIRVRVGGLQEDIRIKLWRRMRLRLAEADNLLSYVTEAFQEIKGLRAASREKLEAIVRLSRLVLPVSRDDAEVLFNEALNIAKEIDREAIDQIEFLAVLAEKAKFSCQSDRRKIAGGIFTFVSCAAFRISGYDGFSWQSAVQALTCMDNAIALAGVCRWADEGAIRLDVTLGPYLLQSLKKGIISPEIAVSLALITDGADGNLRKELIDRVAAEPRKYYQVIEELSKDTLLHCSRQEMPVLGRKIVDQIPQDEFTEGPWLEKLRKTVAFLNSLIEKQKNETKPDRNKRAIFHDNATSPKKFVFDPQGCSFTTPESLSKVLKEAKTSELIYNDRELLYKMREVSSHPRDRIPYLDALDTIPEELIRSTDRVDEILDSLDLWSGTPAVDRWCREKLPSVLIRHFHGIVRWIEVRRPILDRLLEYTGLKAEKRIEIILSGVSRMGHALNSRSLFAIAGMIANAIDGEESAELMHWYCKRLLNRLSEEEISIYSISSIPENESETFARFLFALMSDIDTRIRWKAAHTLRRLAKLGCFDIVDATVLESSRVGEDAFRDPTAPFYFLAAKLWLLISLYRISFETPDSLAPRKNEIYNIAVSSELPHIAIREYAKRTLQQLASSGAIYLNSTEIKRIDKANIAHKGHASKKRRSTTSYGFGHKKRGNLRFSFDEIDTIRYWYTDITNIFPNVSMDEVLEIAEHWIIDKWGADPEAAHWNKEFRKKRIDEHNFGLYSHSHGILPRIERFSRYLEWHAMHCVWGQLLTKEPVSNNEYSYFESNDYCIMRILPTEQPRWLFDNRGPTPLEPRLWQIDPRTDRGWLHNTRLDEFVSEIGIHKPLRPGWIVVDGGYRVHFPKREADIRISSALVSPETAPALVRALQTAYNPKSFRIPDENDDLEIESPPYCLTGWIAYNEGDLRFDDHDPFRHEVGQVRAKPGKKLMETLDLEHRFENQHLWADSDSGEVVFFYEAWSDKPIDDENQHSTGLFTEGFRLWAKTDKVRSFLAQKERDLIFEVQINRRLRVKYGRSYEENYKKKTHEKILLLKRDGSIHDIKQRVGTWTRLGSRIGVGIGC